MEQPDERRNSVNSPIIGIWGGGQLALMLCEAAKALGIRTRLAVKRENEPAVKLADEFQKINSPNDHQSLKNFIENLDLMLFESELVDLEPLLPLVKNRQLEIFPSLEAMQVCGDKLQQKQMMLKYGIPTARFEVVEAITEERLDRLKQVFPRGFVLKWSRQGYDGKGNCFYNPKAASASLQDMKNFVVLGTGKGAQVYAEELIPYQQELALVSIAPRQGDLSFYPLVQTVQSKGICHWVQGPAKALDMHLSPTVQEQAQDIARKISQGIDLRGCFAIEFFLDQQGRLLTNEIAPRVHNSGHFTQNACPASQFENHLRAALNYPLSRMETPLLFGMLNILGPEGRSGSIAPPQLSEPNAWLHWYGKSECRPGRKLGHINYLATSIDELKERQTQLTKLLQTWSEL